MGRILKCSLNRNCSAHTAGNEEAPTSDKGPDLEDVEYVVSRRNDDPKHEEGIKHITPELREAAHNANPVDNALHEFVSAMFCHRLQETGLLQHPLIAEELGTYGLLYERWGERG